MVWHDHPEAPSADTPLCALQDIPDGSCREFVFGSAEDALRLLIFRDQTEAWGYVNICPHFHIPLNSKPDHFFITARRRIMCAYHCSVFRFEDGYCTEGPGKGMSLEPVALKIMDDHIFIVEV